MAEHLVVAMGAVWADMGWGVWWGGLRVRPKGQGGCECVMGWGLQSKSWGWAVVPQQAMGPEDQ